MKNILKYVLSFLVMITIFLIALTLSSLFPREWINKTTKESAIILMNQGNPSNVLDVRFDNFTDTLMVNTAYSIDSNKPFESALLARRNYLPDKNQIIYEDINVNSNVNPNEKIDIMTELYLTVDDNINQAYEYARYWHGYITILRPLLIFFNVNQIRLICVGLLSILSTIFILLLSKRIKFKYCLVVLLTLFVTDYFLIGFTFQGVMTFVIGIVVSCIICIRYEKIKILEYIFLLQEC